MRRPPVPLVAAVGCRHAAGALALSITAGAFRGRSIVAPPASPPSHPPWSTSGQTPAATNTQTLFNLVNVIMGAGFVTMPYACRMGGWAALAVVWSLCFVFAWTGAVVLDCCARVDAARAAAGEENGPRKPQQGAPPAGAPRAPRAGYEDAAEAAFGPVARGVVSAMMYAELLGICIVYFVLEVGAPSRGPPGRGAFGGAGGCWLAAGAVGGRSGGAARLGRRPGACSGRFGASMLYPRASRRRRAPGEHALRLPGLALPPGRLCIHSRTVMFAD